jgi:hypothetical protein
MEFSAAEKSVELPGAKPCPEWMECVMYRKDRSHPIAIREYLDEVYREPFTGNKDGRNYSVNGPWQTHTKRFLRHKTMIQASRLVFGFVGIFDQDEAERILEGQAETTASDVELASYSGGEVSPEVKRIATKLIARAEKAGAWQATLEYAAEHFSGLNLNYLTLEIGKAKQALATAELLQKVTPSPVSGLDTQTEARNTPTSETAP